MAKSARQKLKLLYLLKLLNDSSENNPVTAARAIAYLGANGISAERKSIYDDIRTLSEYGCDIIEARRGVYLGEREFQTVELKLMIDAVTASGAISERKTAKLIEKLAAFAPPEDRAALKQRYLVRPSVKTVNEKVYMTVDELYAAIYKNYAVTFVYYSYVLKDGEYELVPRRNGQKRTVSPWSLAFDDGFYYLEGYDEDAGIIKHFRVDKIGGVQQAHEGRKGEAEYKAATAKTFGMFGGESVAVKLSVTNDAVGAVLDRFGRLPMLKDGDDRFFVTVSVAVSPVFFGWVMSFGGRIKIVSPVETVEQIRLLAEQNAAIYNTK